MRSLAMKLVRTLASSSSSLRPRRLRVSASIATGTAQAELFWSHYRSWGWNNYGPFRSHHYRSWGWDDYEPFGQKRHRTNKGYER